MPKSHDASRSDAKSNMIRQLLRYLPNTITALRFVLILPIVGALLDENYQLAFYLFFIAGLTDGLDGLLARYYRWTSHLGAFLDPIADKLLLISSFMIFAYLGKIANGLVFAIVARDVWIIIGALIYRIWMGKIDYQPIFMSKLNTLLQISFILLLLLHLGFFKLPLLELGLNLLGVVIFITTVLSFCQYTWFWGRKACYHARNEQ